MNRFAREAEDIFNAPTNELGPRKYAQAHVAATLAIAEELRLLREALPDLERVTNSIEWAIETGLDEGLRRNQ